ncbi:hypothetical protein A4R27_26420 [Priestia endophytica]|nr:hypothetical protein A4R27_26420 [Priestia endophytica]
MVDPFPLLGFQLERRINLLFCFGSVKKISIIQRKSLILLPLRFETGVNKQSVKVHFCERSFYELFVCVHFL